MPSSALGSDGSLKGEEEKDEDRGRYGLFLRDSVWFCVNTCVLCDLPLGDHLFTLGIHQLTVLILL